MRKKTSKREEKKNYGREMNYGCDVRQKGSREKRERGVRRKREKLEQRDRR